MTFQSLILKLSEFWASRGCTLQQPLDVEVGAGTMHPETFLRVLGPGHWNVAYVQPSRRPADGRFGENPNRLFKHHQFQVILKPAPDEVQQLYLESLENCGINPRQHDIRFEEDNWESPTLGAFHRDLFDRYYLLAESLLAAGLIWPALEHCLKCSHLFNILDASNSIGVTERTVYILRVRQLAVGIANAYVAGTGAASSATPP